MTNLYDNMGNDVTELYVSREALQASEARVKELEKELAKKPAKKKEDK